MKSLVDVAVRQLIAERVRSVRPDVRPRWGKMTAHEMLCHLTDSYKAGMGEKAVSSRAGLFERTLMKFGALYVPAPWPRGVKTMPEVEQGVGGTKPVEFETDRQQLLVVIEDFCCRPADRLAGGHPIFGPMTRHEWLRWGYLHADHHLRQFGA